MSPLFYTHGGLLVSNIFIRHFIIMAMEVTIEEALNIELKEVENQLNLTTKKLVEEESKFKDILKNVRNRKDALQTVHHTVLLRKSKHYTISFNNANPNDLLYLKNK